MSYFDEILDKRGLETCPLPLWKLKLTDEEYEQLREVLEKRTHIINNDDIFYGFRKECALFYAEYWRREYHGGTHKKSDVYKCLKSSIHTRNFSDEFYESARRGARNLGIRFYEGERTEAMETMLYQGGLPMNLVTGASLYSGWDRFTRGLVNRHINFDELDLGVVATEDPSMRQFCDQLIDGIEAEQYMLMPFYCKNENDSWFVYLKNLANQERRRRRQLRPFSLDWEFTLDQNANRLMVKYVVKGVQHLPAAFVEEQGLEKFKFFTTQVRVNGKAIDSFDYINFYSRYAVVSKHPYNDGDNVSFFINDAQEAHLSDELDMSVPHLMYRNEKGAYLLGNRLGKADSAVVFPETWTLDNGDISTEAYTWHDTTYQVALIPERYIDPIRLHGEDGQLELSSNAKLVWTEFKGVPIDGLEVSEQLYDANNLLYFICYDAEEDVKQLRANALEFKGATRGEWQRTAPYGRIYARAKDASGRFVTPVRFINIGAREDLAIVNVSESEDTCIVKVKWARGRVTCDNGTKRVNEQWEVKKEDCVNNKIQFTLIPDDNSHNQFTIHVRAPFKEFAIFDLDDKQVTSGAWVPYVDVDKYQYHLVGHYIKQYSYGNVVRELKEIGGKLWIVENGQRLKSIPFEGSLTTLFDSRETLRAMLDKTSENMLNAAVNVEFVTTKGETLSFAVKDSPYRVKTMDNKILIKANQFVDYRGALKLLKLDEPLHEPRVVMYDEEQGFIVPEDVYSWGKMIVVGRTRGRICPGLIDMTQELTGEKRLNIREEAINSIKQEIASSTLGDAFWARVLGWYNRIEKDDIPANSLLEFKCLSEDPIALLCLTFQLFAQCSDDEERETLSNQLKTFSNDLAFQWYWLKKHILKVMMNMQQKIGSLENNVVRNIFIQWAMQQENPMQYLTDMNSDSFQLKCLECLASMMTEYQQWMINLAVESLTDKYEDGEDTMVKEVANEIVNKEKGLCYIDDHEEYFVETRQDRSWKISPFFDKYAEHSWHTEAENWLWKRINVAAAHMKGELDLFNLPEEVSDGVRRSLIFCSKSCNHKFVIELNNKLARK